VPDETPRHRYELIIQATTARVFAALTDPAQVERYYLGFTLASEGTPGSAYTLANGKGDVQIAGTNLEVAPGRRLAQTFRFVNGKDPDSRVTWTLEAWGKTGTHLTLVHDGFDGETDTYQGVAYGWPGILSGLKTWLETGKELEYVE